MKQHAHQVWGLIKHQAAVPFLSSSSFFFSFFLWRGSFNSFQEILLGVFLPLTGFLGQIMGTNIDINPVTMRLI